MDDLNPHTDLARFYDGIEDVLRATLALGRSLQPSDALRPSTVPGWTVQDHVSHVVGLEAVMGGAPEPDVEVGDLPHLHNEFDRYMETHVEARRGVDFSEVLDELEALIPGRMEQYRSLGIDPAATVNGPLGERTLENNVPIRLLDLWAHEQDIALSVGQMPRTNSLGGKWAEQRTLEVWALLWPKQLDIDVDVAVTSSEPATGTVTTKLVRLGDVHADERDGVFLAGDRTTITQLGFGRRTVEELLAECTVEGDERVIEALAPLFAFTP